MKKPVRPSGVGKSKKRRYARGVTGNPPFDWWLAQRNRRKKDAKVDPDPEPVNLYLNPRLEGGADIVDGDSVSDPYDHVYVNFSGSDMNSPYHDGEVPAYTWNPTGDPVRGGQGQTRNDLPPFRIYRLAVDMKVEGYVEGVNIPNELRGVNVNALSQGGNVDLGNANHSGTDGVWERVWWDFYIDSQTGAGQCQLRHGCGMIEVTTLTMEFGELSLTDIGPYPSGLGEDNPGIGTWVDARVWSDDEDWRDTNAITTDQ